jgi:hypothetical protein
MFRKPKNNIVTCVGIDYNAFKELKKMNVMIPEMHEKMWMEKVRWGYDDIVFANVSDYKLIELLDDYYILYIDEPDEDNELYKESIEEKINEYRGVDNGDSIDNEWLLP